MQSDPSEEWRRLTEAYRDMSEEELRNLAEDFDDLTENAKQALRQEMRSRGLGDPQSPLPIIESQRSWNVERKSYDLLAGPLANSYVVPSDPDEVGHEEVRKHDYTWKTLLCECNEVAVAQQISEMLTRAGIENWPEALPRYAIGLGSPKIYVAADQLEQARAIAAQPIPQEIIDDSKAEVPDYVVPKCPKCGAEDPILEAVEPTNTWCCEQCDYKWSDPADAAVDSPAKDGQPSS